MKVQEVLEKFHNTKLEKAVHIGFVGSYLNFLEDAIDELDDEQIFDKYKELQDLIIDKREELGKQNLSYEEWY